MAESKAKVIDQLDRAIKSTSYTYDKVSNGEMGFYGVGARFEMWLADEVLTAMKKALELLREEESK